MGRKVTFIYSVLTLSQTYAGSYYVCNLLLSRALWVGQCCSCLSDEGTEETWGHTESKLRCNARLFYSKIHWAKANNYRDEEKSYHGRRNKYKTMNWSHQVCLLSLSPPRTQYIFYPQFILNETSNWDVHGWSRMGTECKLEPLDVKGAGFQQSGAHPTWCYIFPSKAAPHGVPQKLQSQIGPGDWDRRWTTSKMM